MMLAALVDYYRRLENDEQSELAPFGFSKQKVAFRVVLESDGTLVGIEDERVGEGKVLAPHSLTVPGEAKPPGAGINPCFLWDNPAYMLGFKSDDPKPERTVQAFEAFRERHLDAEEEINDEQFSAVCAFLKKWKPKYAEKHPVLSELTSGFGVFRIRAKKTYVHESKRIVKWWLRQLESESQSDDGFQSQCLITGENGPIAQLHDPAIKGVAGGQSSGAKLVSFNCDAFESYGKSQSYNAPVSKNAAFQYANALNLLLATEKQRVRLGDTTIVFWTAKPTPAELVFGSVLGAMPSEDEGEKIRLEGMLRKLANGVYPTDLGEPKTPFYILGLSPNAARLSVRFWLESTLGDTVRRVGEHYRDLAIQGGPRDREFPSPYFLLRETAREVKDVPPLLEGALLRAIWTGIAYPDALYTAVLRRIRADRSLSHVRVAIIKACLQRRSRLGLSPLIQEISMSLDPDYPEPAYQLGRLFASLEKSQEDAIEGINDTIKDRYFGAASATPQSVFPRLIRLNQHHLGKLEKPARVNHEKRIQEIAGRIQTFPAHMNLRDQGLFAIGYYHQRQNFFTKKSSSEPKVDNKE